MALSLSLSTNWVICIFPLQFNKFHPWSSSFNICIKEIWKWCSINVKFVSSCGVKKCFAWRKNLINLPKIYFIQMAMKADFGDAEKNWWIWRRKRNCNDMCIATERLSDETAHRVYGYESLCMHYLHQREKRTLCANYISPDIASRCNEVKLIEA